MVKVHLFYVFHIGAGHSPYLILFANIHYQGNDDQILTAALPCWKYSAAVAEPMLHRALFRGDEVVLTTFLELQHVSCCWISCWQTWRIYGYFWLFESSPTQLVAKTMIDDTMMIPKAFRGWPIFLGEGGWFPNPKLKHVRLSVWGAIKNLPKW